MKKRAISILLAMVMVLGYLLPAGGFTALAAEGTSSAGLEPAPIGNTIIERLKKGKTYSIVVVAEGIKTIDGKKAAEYIAQEIEYETGFETRETVLGYIQRGGAPTAFDRNLATRMGGYATEMIATGQFGRMVALQGDQIGSIPLEEVAGKLKMVDPDSTIIQEAKMLGISFGD